MTNLKSAASTLWEVEAELRSSLRSAILFRKAEARESWGRARQLIGDLTQNVLIRKEKVARTPANEPVHPNTNQNISYKE